MTDVRWLAAALATRLACWISVPDNAFGVLVLSTAPLFAICVIGMVGAP